MSDDVLGNEVSIGAEVSGLSALPVEVNAKAKSRFVSAIDRFAGNIVDFPNAWLEAKPAKKRAETAAAVAIIKARSEVEADTIKAGIGKIAAQNALPEPFVQKAVEKLVLAAVRSQEKEILLLQEAMEDLKQRPPNAEEAENGTDILDEGFLNRLEKRVEEATQEEIRAKWGRVLAGEIRRPGTFSAKLMRIVDELEPETAKLFEDICRWRINDGVLACLSGTLEFSKQKKLENAELLTGSEQGLLIKFNSGIQKPSGTESWYITVKSGNLGLGFLKNLKLPNSFSKFPPLISNGSECAIPAYALTPVGYALASILEDKQEEAFYAYLKKLSEFLPEVEIEEYKKSDHDSMKLTRKWKNGKPLL